MSYECCKGCYTRPCEICFKQLCPTSSHRQMHSVGNYTELCWDCYFKIKYEPQNLYSDILKYLEEKCNLSEDQLEKFELKFKKRLKNCIT